MNLFSSFDAILLLGFGLFLVVFVSEGLPWAFNELVTWAVRRGEDGTYSAWQKFWQVVLTIFLTSVCLWCFAIIIKRNL